MLSTLQSEVRNHLASNKTRLAIDLLLNATQGRAHDDIILLSARFSAFEQEQKAGFLTRAEIDRKRNVLNNAILGTVESLDSQDVRAVPRATKPEATPPPPPVHDRFVPLADTAAPTVTYEEARFSEIQPLIEKGLVLLVTATETETTHLHQKMQPLPGRGGLIEVKKDSATYYIGLFGRFMVAHVECGTMGASSSMGSTLTVTNAISALEPKLVLMVGIAFGVDDTKQNIGDVLVSDKLIPYEIQRVSQDTLEWRGSKPEANNSLRNSFKNVRVWENQLPNGDKAALELCDLLVGEKLVDNIDYRNQLKAQFPTAKGGEMEGAGLYIACNDKNRPWILVKAICDFADGQKKQGKTEKQALAIEMALRACLAVFNKQFVFEDLGIGAYDTTPKKADMATAAPPSTKAQLMDLLNNGHIASLFGHLHTVSGADTYSLHRFQKEYEAGLKGIDLVDWKERLTLFINGLDMP